MTTLSHITMELARGPEFPFGDRQQGYHLYLPLTEEGRVKIEACGHIPSACRVRRFRPGEEERRGEMLQGAGGLLQFRYNDCCGACDEACFRLDGATLVPGTRISIRENGDRLRTFEIISVRRE